MLVDGRERCLRFDYVEFEKRCEASQRKNEVRFDRRVAVWGYLPVVHRLSNETFDHCAPIAQSDGNLLVQRRVVQRFENVSRVHTTAGPSVRSKREKFDERYSQHVAWMRRLVERSYTLRDSLRRLIGGELDCEGQHLRAGREVVL